MTEIEEESAGLRERKKRRTRATIAATALELFDRQGFESTTIAQIADAAEVAPRTVYSYFPVKEDLAFPDREEWLERFRLFLTERQAGTTALSVMPAWFESCAQEWLGQGELLRRRQRVIEASPVLRAFSGRIIDQALELLAAEIARDLAQDPDDLEPRLVAAALVSVFEVLADRFRMLESAEPDQVGDEGWPLQARQMVEQALRFVAGGIEAIDSSPG